MNPKVIETKQKSNARILASQALIPVHNYEVYDEEQQIWVGYIIPDTIQGLEMRAEGQKIYFSRKYDTKNNDVDRMICEYHFKEDESVLGFEFILIPREKYLFMFDPPSILAKPPILLPSNRRRRQ